MGGRDQEIIQERMSPAEKEKSIDSSERPLPGSLMFFLAVLIGTVGGLGSIAFKAIIGFFHNLFFYGEFNLNYDANIHTQPSPWGIGVVFVPVLGSLLVTWITRTVAPEARGHGVPEVLHAIYYGQGRIRPVVVIAKAIASSVTIGTGGSVGREGPIVQIGSAFGSIVGQLTRLPAHQRVVLIGAGAAAGIAATFNAPIGGLAFAIELLLVSISARTVALVAIATVTATYISHFYSGLQPSFDVPSLAVFENHVIGFYTLLLCVPLGILLGCASSAFIRLIYYMEDWFDQHFRNDYVRHMCGMFAVGIMLYLFLRYSGHYYVGGVGYATVMDTLRRTLSDPAFLIMLFLAKLLATGLTLGSGGSGGVFSPSLFLGATLGSAFGNLFALLIPNAGIDPVVFTVAGMAGMVGGSTGAVLTAITMLFEQTRDYSAMLPIITTVSLAYVVRISQTPESIYTLKLVRRGVRVPQGLQAAVSSVRNARTIMTNDYQIVEIGDLPEWQANHRPGQGPRHTVVVQDGKILGLAHDELQYLLRDEDPKTLIDTNFFLVTARTPWPTLIRGMRAKDTEKALVTRNRGSTRVEDLLGVITPREIARSSGASAVLMD
ncbi:MAG: chloride channel protein [Nitrococcus mobilis]|nr:chloride channel protein [Nitrococcus mobilis]